MVVSPSFPDAGLFVLDGRRAARAAFRATAADAPMTADARFGVRAQRRSPRCPAPTCWPVTPIRYPATRTAVRIGEASSEILVTECENLRLPPERVRDRPAPPPSSFRAANYSHFPAQGARPSRRIFPPRTRGRGDVGVLPGGDAPLAWPRTTWVESAKTGVRVMGRSEVVAFRPCRPWAADPVTGNRVLGNLVIAPPRTAAFPRRQSLHGPDAVHRNRPASSSTTELTDKRGPGRADRPGIQRRRSAPRISQFTSVGARGRRLHRRDQRQTWACTAIRPRSTRLAIGYDKRRLFASTGEVAWGFRPLARPTATLGQAFVPMDAHVTSPIAGGRHGRSMSGGASHGKPPQRRRRRRS